MFSRLFGLIFKGLMWGAAAYVIFYLVLGWLFWTVFEGLFG